MSMCSDRGSLYITQACERVIPLDWITSTDINFFFLRNGADVNQDWYAIEKEKGEGESMV